MDRLRVFPILSSRKNLQFFRPIYAGFRGYVSFLHDGVKRTAEYWSGGVMECWDFRRKPLSHHSSTPLLLHSNTPRCLALSLCSVGHVANPTSYSLKLSGGSGPQMLFHSGTLLQSRH